MTISSHTEAANLTIIFYHVSNYYMIISYHVSNYDIIINSSNVSNYYIIGSTALCTLQLPCTTDTSSLAINVFYLNCTLYPEALWARSKVPCINVKIMIPVSQWNLSVQTTLKELSRRGLRGAVISHQVTMDDNAHSFQTTLKKIKQKWPQRKGNLCWGVCLHGPWKRSK